MKTENDLNNEERLVSYMEKIAPIWVLWVSMIMLIVACIVVVINMLLSLRNLYDLPGSTLGNLFGTIALIYLLGYIQVSILYDYIKKHKK